MQDEKIVGLTKEEVEIRVANGQRNIEVKIKSKTIPMIIATNIFTYLNLIIYSIAFLLILIGEYINALFVFPTIFNMLVGIVQEIRIKFTIERLTMLNQATVTVIRDGNMCDIKIEQLVLDDIIYVKTGDQICSDAIVIKGTNFMVNESLLTGESDPITKNTDDEILSGSFVTTGFGYARVNRVGEDNYASKIMMEAKQYKKTYSEILYSLNRIIKIVGIFIIPLGVMLFFSNYLRDHEIIESIVTSAGGIVSMVPQGLIVLSSISFALGIIKMAKHNAFLKSLPSIETFSRINVICFDKTGTLTEGNPYVDKVDYINDKKHVVEAISNINSSLAMENPTSEALHIYFGAATEYKTIDVLPFSSEKKISAVSFEEHGTYILGACEFILNDKLSPYYRQIEAYESKGFRVIVLAHSDKALDEDFLQDVKLEAIIVLRDKIKRDAKRIINYLKRENVDVKIISGDNPLTTSMIASYCGVDNYDKYVNVSALSNPDYDELVKKYTVFGRTTPLQKKELILAFKRQGLITAMTGDGINDILALKESDFSIAMASGSEATKNVAEVVLMDSNFSAFPKILNESRKIINNITNLATLYVTKTIYSFALVILFIILPLPYPFIPIQMSIISTLTIGIPSFFFIFTPFEGRPKGEFLKTILLKSLPFALVIVFNLLVISIFGIVLNIEENILSTLSLISTSILALTLVYYVSKPINNTKRLFIASLIMTLLLILVFWREFFSLEIVFNMTSLITMALAVISSLILMKFYKIKL